VVDHLASRALCNAGNSLLARIFSLQTGVVVRSNAGFDYTAHGLLPPIIRTPAARSSALSCRAASLRRCLTCALKVRSSRAAERRTNAIRFGPKTTLTWFGLSIDLSPSVYLLRDATPCYALGLHQAEALPKRMLGIVTVDAA